MEYGLLATLFFGGVFSTIAGGGLGIIMLIAGTFFFDIQTTIVFSSLLMLGIQLAKISHFWKQADWEVVLYWCLGGIPASVLGGLTMFSVPGHFLELGVGALCVLFVIVRLLKPHWSIPRLPGLLTCLGTINGYLGGIIGNTALMRNPVLLSVGLQKEVLIGTSSVVALVLNIGKISAYVSMTTLTTAQWILVALAVPLLWVSVSIGKYFLQFVSPAWFERLLLVVVCLGAVKLLLA